MNNIVNNDQQYCLKHCEQCCFIVFLKQYCSLVRICSQYCSLECKTGRALLLQLGFLVAVQFCKPVVYFKSMHAQKRARPGQALAGVWQRREHDSSSRRRRISKNVASETAVVAAASSFFASKRPPSKIITQQQHHMIHDATHSASCRRLATSRDYIHLAANPDFNSNATGIGRATNFTSKPILLVK
jgi:hypothetical protein